MTQAAAPRFVAGSPDELRDIGTRHSVEYGDRALCTVKGRQVLLEAEDGGRLGLIWAEVVEACNREEAPA